MQVFIGSSQESLNNARILAEHLETLPDIKVRIWNDTDMFIAGEYTLETLEQIACTVDAALFVFSEDDKTWYRDKEMSSVRDNVIFEYGLFAGKLSIKKVAIVQIGNPKQVSDLKGINYIHYDSSKPNTGRRKISNWVANVRNYTITESNEPIFTTSLLQALNYGINSAPSIDTLKIFAISTSFSAKVFRAESSLRIKNAYVLLRQYNNKDDLYYSQGMEESIKNAVSSWRKMQEYENISNLNIGFFNYHPDEGFYLIDNRVLIVGILHTFSDMETVEFDSSVVVVKNNSKVGQEIINLYQRRFDYLMKNFLKHG